MKRIFLLLLFALAGPLHAQTVGDPAGPSFGGLGSVSGGLTNRATYLGGTPEGAFQNSQFGLRVSVPFDDRLTVSSLINWREEGREGGTPRTDITYLFATYRLSRAWDLRLGKVKNPTNLYSEVYDIGTLRPFLTLPQGIYGGTGNAFTSYTGVGVNGTAYVGRWQLAMAGYLSGGNFRYNSTRIALLPGTNGELDVNLHRAVGGRLLVRPPVAGLSVGVSGSLARIGFGTCGVPALQTLCEPGFSGGQGSAQLEYLTDRLWLRSEITLRDVPGFVLSRGGYAQAAWFLTRKWQVAAQYDVLTETLGQKTLDLGASAPLPEGFTLPPGLQLPPGGLGSLLPDAMDRHRDLAFGVNYWLAPEVALKLSVHDVDGWRFARPETAQLLQGALTGQFPSKRSRLLQAGIQFNF